MTIFTRFCWLIKVIFASPIYVICGFSWFIWGVPLWVITGKTVLLWDVYDWLNDNIINILD